jgi:antibiotic biosynthesis monooxygenase (ABM) superfamily enzyme
MQRGNWQGYILAAFTGVILAMSASAQEPNITRVTTYRVKPDRAADFQAEIKEYNAVLKKAGASHAYTLWSSLTGAVEFYRVDEYAKYAELDNADDPKLKDVSADLARIGLRITNCEDSADRVYYRGRPDLSLPPVPEIPKMVRLLKAKLQPDKVEAYIAMKKEYIALLKKSPPKFESVLQGRYGTSQWEFLTLEGINRWADLDVPQPADDPSRKFNFSATQTERQYDIIRFRPELSYIPGTGTN